MTDNSNWKPFPANLVKIDGRVGTLELKSPGKLHTIPVNILREEYKKNTGAVLDQCAKDELEGFGIKPGDDYLIPGVETLNGFRLISECNGEIKYSSEVHMSLSAAIVDFATQVSMELSDTTGTHN